MKRNSMRSKVAGPTEREKPGKEPTPAMTRRKTVQKPHTLIIKVQEGEHQPRAREAGGAKPSGRLPVCTRSRTASASRRRRQCAGRTRRAGSSATVDTKKIMLKEPPWWAARRCGCSGASRASAFVPSSQTPQIFRLRNFACRLPKISWGCDVRT